jgi:putative nucleotidyltransferase with HDIG domain
MDTNLARLNNATEQRLQPTLERIRSLPALPRALQEVLRVLRDGQLSRQRCVTLIEQDPAFAAATLRLANSAFYGVPRQVGSVTDGVHLLGLNAVAGVLTATALAQHMRPRSCAGFNSNLYWRHALLVGQAARAMAPQAHIDADMAFLAGLLHDVGQLAMASYWPEETAEAWSCAAREGVSPEVAEAAVLGLGHPQLGAMLVHRWHFPDSLVDAVERHHDVPRPNPQALSAEEGLAEESMMPPLTELVQLANALVEAQLKGQASESLPAWAATRFTRWGLSDLALAPMIDDLVRGASRLEAVFQVG